MADDRDILSLAEAKRAVNSQATNPDLLAVLEQQVTAVSLRIDEACGPVVQRTVEAELHEGGATAIQLARYPVLSVNEVNQVALDGTETEITAAGYRLFKAGGVLTRLSGGYPISWLLDASISVTYEAGRFEDTAAVEADWKLGCAEIVGEVWKQNSARWARSSSFTDPDEEPWGYLAIDDMVRRRFKRHLRPPALSIPVVFDTSYASGW